MTTLPPNTEAENRLPSPLGTGMSSTAPRTAAMDPDEIAEPRQARAPAPSRPEATVASRPAALSKPGLAVHLRGLRAFYGEAEQVKGVDLEFRANEVTAIIGPVGLRQVDDGALHQPHARGDPRRPRRGQGAARRLRRL